MGEPDLVERARAYLAANAAESGADVLIAELADEVESLKRTTERLSKTQLTWLRGLSLAKGWVTMCATELGDPGVSELQSLSLVRVLHTDFAGIEWQITAQGRKVINHAAPPPGSQVD